VPCFNFLALINHSRILPHASFGTKNAFFFIKIIAAWMFLYSQTLTYFFAKIQCPYVKWKPYALSYAEFLARGNVFEKRYMIPLARVRVRRIVKVKSRVLNEISASTSDLERASLLTWSKFVE
jgi:hypothetical protein